jgi:NTE family protein
VFLRAALVLAALLCALPAGLSWAQEQERAAPPPGPRPRTGLVLSGGGARGAAHVGVLKVLEELRIPVDYIAGTSMGSIVGGLYASGLSPQSMELTFNDIDWKDALTDEPPRKNISFRRKEDDHEALFRFELGIGKGGIIFPSGLIAGQKLGFILRSLTLHVANIDRFDELAIPFRAVAADLDDGQMVVLDGGDLADALRASMSVPGAFTPVVLEGRTLVDGGIVRNLPVDIARAMGAERLIAVDVSTPPKGVVEDQSIFGVWSQTYDLLTYENVLEQKALLSERDLLIVPDLTDIHFAAFTQMPDAIDRGEAAARRHESALRAFSVSEEEYEIFLAEQRRGAARLLEEVVIDEIRVTGLDRVDRRIVDSRIETRPGEPLNLRDLSGDLERIYRIGEFQQVDFRIRHEDDRNVLGIDAHEKSWGPGYIRFGLALESDLAGEGEFTFLMNYRRTHLNALGAEWKSIVKFGDVDALFTEFFQPLEFSGFWFVSPQLDYERDKDEISLETGELVLLDGQRFEGFLDIGVQFRNYGEIRIGAGRGTLDIDNLTDPAVMPLDVDLGGWRAKLTLDQLDNAYFPRYGTLARAELFLSREDLGADDPYDKLELQTTYARSIGAHTIIGSVRFGTDLGSDIPFYDEFSLGGFLNLSGLRPDVLRGDVSGFLALGYYWQVARLPSALGGGVYLGGTLEAGNVWDDISDAELGGLRKAGLIFTGAETLLGPLYLGYGRAEGGEDSFYLFLGQVF